MSSFIDISTLISSCKLCTESEVRQLNQQMGHCFRLDTDAWTKPKIGLASVEQRTFMFVATNAVEAQVGALQGFMYLHTNALQLTFENRKTCV